MLWIVRCSNVISFKLIWRHMKLLRFTVLSKIAILLLLACFMLFVCIYDTPASISLWAQLFWMIFMCSCGLWDAAMSYPFNLFKGIRNCFALQLSLKSQFFLLLAGLLLLVWLNEKKNFRDFLPLSSILLAASLSNPHCRSQMDGVL